MYDVPYQVPCQVHTLCRVHHFPDPIAGENQKLVHPRRDEKPATQITNKSVVWRGMVPYINSSVLFSPVSWLILLISLKKVKCGAGQASLSLPYVLVRIIWKLLYMYLVGAYHVSCAQKLCYASRAEAGGIYKNFSGKHTDRLPWSTCAPRKTRRDEKQSPTTRSQSTKTTLFGSNRILSRWHNAAIARTTNSNPSPKSGMIFTVAADSFDALQCVAFVTCTHRAQPR